VIRRRLCGFGKAVIILALVFHAGIGVAQGAPVLFTNEAAFNAAVAAAGITLAKDNFESLPEGKVSSPFDRGAYQVTAENNNPPFVDLVIDNHPSRFTDGNNVLVGVSPILPMRFDFDQTIRAFSVDVIDAMIIFGDGEFRVSVGPNAPIVAFGTQTSFNIKFVGVLDLDGFSTLALTTFQEGLDTPASTIRLDRLQYENGSAPPPSVPEPTTMALVGSGIVGLIARRRARGARLE